MRSSVPSMMLPLVLACSVANPLQTTAGRLIFAPAARPSFHRRLPPLRLLAAATPNLDGLRKEAARQLERGYKKLTKAENRATASEARQTELLAMDNPPLAELEKQLNCAELRLAANAMLDRVTRLQQLCDGLQALGSSADERFADLVAQAEALEVGDSPPPRPQRTKKKPKGPRPSKAPRIPYRAYASAEGAEIRVGRTAADNDLLSCDPKYRDPLDWWMHASGCPGSHVTIRADSLPGGTGAELPKEVELDAAILAAKYSKAQHTGKVLVNLCRARQVSKPIGAKPGLVRLSGDVRTVRIDWRKERSRLERLEAQHAPPAA